MFLAFPYQQIRNLDKKVVFGRCHRCLSIFSILACLVDLQPTTWQLVNPWALHSLLTRLLEGLFKALGPCSLCCSLLKVLFPTAITLKRRFLQFQILITNLYDSVKKRCIGLALNCIWLSLHFVPTPEDLVILRR